jgi:hypothetical protein
MNISSLQCQPQENRASVTPEPRSKSELRFTEKIMKRLIASAVVLSVVAAPAAAATTTKAPAKVTKQVKNSSNVTSTAKQAAPKKK